MNARELEAKRLFMSNLSFYLFNGMDRCPFIQGKVNSPSDYIKVLDAMWKSAEQVVAEGRWWMRWFILPMYHFCLKVWR